MWIQKICFIFFKRFSSSIGWDRHRSTVTHILGVNNVAAPIDTEPSEVKEGKHPTLSPLL